MYTEVVGCFFFLFFFDKCGGVVQCSIVLECCCERVKGYWADGDCPCPVDA